MSTRWLPARSAARRASRSSSARSFADRATKSAKDGVTASDGMARRRHGVRGPTSTARRATSDDDGRRLHVVSVRRTPGELLPASRRASSASVVRVAWRTSGRACTLVGSGGRAVARGTPGANGREAARTVGAAAIASATASGRRLEAGAPVRSASASSLAHPGSAAASPRRGGARAAAIASTYRGAASKKATSDGDQGVQAASHASPANADSAHTPPPTVRRAVSCSSSACTVSTSKGAVYRIGDCALSMESSGTACGALSAMAPTSTTASGVCTTLG
mmetsp:Transcript_15178/g.47369  ORF Transcript_15178/g.47369 Transcript_15178/m.47369 type:complete len:279 (+) Transcript_15178:436-1272(+)